MRSDHISNYYNNKLMGMAINMRYLLRLLTLASAQNLARDTIDVFPDAMRALMS